MKAKKWQPEAIKKSHVTQAAKYWNRQESYAPFRDSNSYDVIIGARPYPPKAIASKAHELATGIALLPSDFAGAKDGLWHRTLKGLGFAIVEKDSNDALAYEVSTRLKGSREARLRRLAKAINEKPIRTAVTVNRFIRNPDVVAECLYLAKGKCGKCKEPAPFKRLIDGTPFLEVHHKKPLSEGGPDTVENTIALCPNCHAQTHDELKMGMTEE
jgi:5-methylcytosine-specific restriction protein A